MAQKKVESPFFTEMKVMDLTPKPQGEADSLRRNTQLVPISSQPEWGTPRWVLLTITQVVRSLIKAFASSKELDDEQTADQLGHGLALAYYQRGNSHYEQNDLQGALADYTKAINLNKQLLLAYIHRGNVCYELDYLDHAKTDYSRAIELDPTNTLAYCNRGNIHTQQQHYDQALQDYEHAFALDPKLLLIYWGRGMLYWKMGRYEAALDDFYRYLNLAPNTDNHEMFEKWILELEQML